MSDVENEIDDKDIINYTDNYLVSSKYGINDVGHKILDKDTESFKEFQEFIKVDLSGENIYNYETQIKHKDDDNPPTTRDEYADKIPAVKPLLNYSDPTKVFQYFTDTIHCNDLSEVTSNALDTFM